MKKIVVIPSYWSRPKDEGWQEGDAVYDHPTPIDSKGTLARTLESMKILTKNDYTLAILVCPTHSSILDQAQNKVIDIINEVGLDTETVVFTPKELEKIVSLAEEHELSENSIKLLNMTGYPNVRNICLYFGYILGGDVLILIDDDELFEKPNFIELSTEFIGRRLYGKTIDGVAGYYINRNGTYYDDVNIEPWMTYWNRFGSKTKAFDKIIGNKPRMKMTPFVFGGAMIIHRNLFKTVPFDPRVKRGEDIDYLINAKMFGFHFFLDCELSIKHLPEKKHHPVWKSFREDIYRFLYDKKKIETQYEIPNMNIVTAEDFDPYPGGFLKSELEDMIFKANVMLGMDYMTNNDIEGAKECIKNIYLSKYDAVPQDDVFTYFRKLQKSWQDLIKFTKENMIKINDIIAPCSTECKIQVEDITAQFAQNEISKMLRDTNIFSGASKKTIDVISKFIKIKNYTKNQIILKIKEKTEEIYIIIEGKVRISVRGTSGEETVLSVLERGQVFGESHVTGETAYVNITSDEDDTVILSFKNEALEELFTNHPRAGIELFIAFTKELSGKLSEQNKKYMEEINKNVELEM